MTSDAGPTIGSQGLKERVIVGMDQTVLIKNAHRAVGIFVGLFPWKTPSLSSVPPNGTEVVRTLRGPDRSGEGQRRSNEKAETGDAQIALSSVQHCYYC